MGLPAAAPYTGRRAFKENAMPDGASNRRDLRPQPRPLRRSLVRGWRRCCPACGKGPLLRGYLTVRSTCPVCGEPLDKGVHLGRLHAATATLVALPLLAAWFWSQSRFAVDPMVPLSVAGVGGVALTLSLLPRMKGAAIAFQWARRRHGFADT